MLIAKSDMVILVVSVSLLTVGIYRWQSNVSQVSERRAVASSPAATQQRPSASSLAAKPVTNTAAVSPVTGAGNAVSVENNFGNAGQTDALQSSTQNAAVSTGSTTTSANLSSSSNTAGQLLYGTYEVQSGDSLSKIAIDYGTTVDTLRIINDISGSLITVGQNIRYPLPAN